MCKGETKKQTFQEVDVQKHLLEQFNFPGEQRTFILLEELILPDITYLFPRSYIMQNLTFAWEIRVGLSN